MSETRLARLFSDHMVLQRGVRLPVWGWGSPGEQLVVCYVPSDDSGDAEQSVPVTAGQDGKWLAWLAPLGASRSPGRLIVTRPDGRQVASAEDVLVGEVWLASGQSNMQWTVRDSMDAEAEIAAADLPAIRMFNVPRAVCPAPAADVNAQWAVCSPRTVAEFSAVAYYFGRSIHRDEGVPVGLLNCSWGGTRVETWMSREALLADGPGRAEVEQFEAKIRSVPAEERQRAIAEQAADPQAWIRRNSPADPGNVGERRGWADPAFDDSAWPHMELPSIWQNHGVPGSGVLWFRRAIDVPPAWAGRDLALHLGACDKHDQTWFNGEQIGAMGWETLDAWAKCRVYKIPGRLVKPGRNLLAVRVYSYRNAGGIYGPANEMWAAPEGAARAEAISLVGPWRFTIEHDFGVIPPAEGNPLLLPDHNSPYSLYQSMLLPLAPYAIRGAIWYQGESNAAQAALYRHRFPRMIGDWRRLWASPALPFLFVQLANYKSSGHWPALREAQTLTLREPATAMAVAIDIGEPEDIHPRNKQEVGRRLALAARAKVYGRPVDYSGPMYQSHRVEGDSIRVRFDHVGGGLISAGGGELQGFTVAGADRAFQPAIAVIEAVSDQQSAAGDEKNPGETIVVRSPQVRQPVAVRYAWQDDPACNLFNRAGLPASPFRTDEW